MSTLTNKGAAVYIVCTHRHANESLVQDGRKLLEFMATSKVYTVDVFNGFEVDSEFKASISNANIKMMTRDIGNMDTIHRFFKSKDFQGAALQALVKKQEELTKLWKDYFEV